MTVVVIKETIKFVVENNVTLAKAREVKNQIIDSANEFVVVRILPNGIQSR